MYVYITKNKYSLVTCTKILLLKQAQLPDIYLIFITKLL